MHGVQEKTKALLTLTLMLAMTILLSCGTNGGDSHAAEARELLAALTRNDTNPDSLMVVAQDIADSGDATKRELIAQASAFDDGIRALALIFATNPEALADSLLSARSADLAAAVASQCRRLNMNDELQSVSMALTERFEGMDNKAKAQLVTSMFTPSQCASALEKGDGELAAEIRGIYHGDSIKLREFDAALKARVIEL